MSKYFQKLLFVGLIALSVIASVAPNIINLTVPAGRWTSNQLLIDKCRKRCLTKTMPGYNFQSHLLNADNIKQCRLKPDCYMCYDYCRVLKVAATGLAQSMCNDRAYCTKGCRTACNFHGIYSLDKLVYELISSDKHNGRINF